MQFFYAFMLNPKRSSRSTDTFLKKACSKLMMLGREDIVYKAAITYRVPEQTLRDRIRGFIKPERRSSGLIHFWMLLRKNLCVHMAMYGYGYSNRELQELATDTAIYLSKWKNRKN